MPPATKRQKLTSDNEHETPDENLSVEDNEESGPELESESGSSDDGERESSPDTEDEIEKAKYSKSKKTLKRKRRATDTTRFGATLLSLLGTDAPSALPLSLKPSVARKRNDEKLEQKSKKVLQVEKKEKEDKGRIKDVIGGWGAESERTLRKVAQRGGESTRFLYGISTDHVREVVKLFNVIQQSQAAASVAAEQVKAQRGSGKPTLPAPRIDGKSKPKKGGKHKDNLLGSRGKDGELCLDGSSVYMFLCFLLFSGHFSTRRLFEQYPLGRGCLKGVMPL